MTFALGLDGWERELELFDMDSPRMMSSTQLAPVSNL